MDKALYTKWILNDRKERHFVRGISGLGKKIIKLLEGEMSPDQIWEFEGIVYCLTREDFSISKEFLDFLTIIPIYYFKVNHV